MKSEKMKQNSHGFFFFFFLISLLFAFLLFSQSASARFLPSKQGEEETQKKLGHGIAQEDLWTDFPDIMGGREKCEEEGEEECLKRRMMQEAHLDYVYTQNEKP